MKIVKTYGEMTLTLEIIEASQASKDAYVKVSDLPVLPVPSWLRAHVFVEAEPGVWELKK